MDDIFQTPEGWWVMRDDTHLSRWVEQGKRLDHDTPVLDKILPHIKPGSTVFDLGAAIGDHTIAYLRAVGEKGVVIAIEPHPVQFACLTRNCPQALCLPYAVGDTEGEVWLFHQPDIVAGSRLVDPACQWPMSRTRCVTLDTNCVLQPAVSFIKLDIEGSETRALRGARRTIMRNRPVIWTEINPEALERQGSSAAELRYILETELRYKVSEFYPEGGSWDGYEDAQCDALLLPQ